MNSPKARGFSLLELIIVVGLLALFSAWAIQRGVRASQEDSQSRAETEYVDEFRQITRASKEFVAANTTWAVGTVNSFAVSDLIAAGLLPTGFAARSTGANQAPMGTRYSMVAQKPATGKPLIVVYETGTNHALYVDNLGFSAPTDPLLTSMKREVATKLRELGLASGTMASGSRVVTGAGSAPWTKDVSALVPAAATVTSVAVLVGFPDLAGIGDPDDETNGEFSGDCIVVAADSSCRTIFGQTVPCEHPNASSYVPPTCPTGYSQADTITMCPPPGTASFRSTPAGSLSYVTVSSTRTYPLGGGCDSTCESSAGSTCEGLTSAFRHQNIRLNDDAMVDGEGVFCGEDRNTNYTGTGYPNCNRGLSRNQNRVYSFTSTPRHLLCCSGG